MFKNKDMSVIAYANGFTLWHYASDDPIDLIDEIGYFPKEIAKLMGLGDIMFITSGSTSYIRQVLSLEGSRVTIGVVN